MTTDIPILSADEAADLLQGLLEKDLEIERLALEAMKAKSALILIKDELKDAMEARSKLSYEIRNPPPLFDRDGNGKPHGPRRDSSGDRPMTPEEVNADLVAGVLEAEAEAGRPSSVESEVCNDTDEDLSDMGLARVFACNGCNTYREPHFHPCPVCDCPEYRIVAVPFSVGRATEAAAKKVGLKAKRGRKAKAVDVEGGPSRG